MDAAAKNSTKGIIMGVLSGVFYGCTPILIVGTTAGGGITGPGCLMLRYFLTSIFLLPFAVRSYKREPINRKTALQVVVAGLLMACTASALYISYRWLTAGIGMAITYLYPVLVLLGGRIFFKRAASRSMVLAVIMCLLAVVFLASFDEEALAAGAWKGVILTIGSAVAYAAFLMWNDEKKLGRVSTILFTEIMTASCGFFIFLYNLGIGGLHYRLTLIDWLRIAAVGVIGPLASGTQIVAIKHVGAMYTSILATLELVICCLGSALILHEPFGVKAAIGTVLMIVATILVTVDSGRKHEEKTEFTKREDI